MPPSYLGRVVKKNRVANACIHIRLMQIIWLCEHAESPQYV